MLLRHGKNICICSEAPTLLYETRGKDVDRNFSYDYPKNDLSNYRLIVF